MKASIVCRSLIFNVALLFLFPSFVFSDDHSQAVEQVAAEAKEALESCRAARTNAIKEGPDCNKDGMTVREGVDCYQKLSDAIKAKCQKPLEKSKKISD